MKAPAFYKWDGGPISTKWSFGWYLPEIDLVCVRPDCQSDEEGNLALSPVCSSRLLAVVAFALKALLVRIDENSRAWQPMSPAARAAKRRAAGRIPAGTRTNRERT